MIVNKIVNADDSATVYLYDVIGDDFFGGISANGFVQDIDALDVSNITVRINSPGGDVFQGMAIHNALQRHPANVAVEVDGIAASIAAVIAMAGDSIGIAENAQIMVHHSMTMAFGNAAELRKTIDVLDQVDENIRDIFTNRTGQDRATVVDWLNDETWFRASDAVENGFADVVNSPMKIAAWAYDSAKMREWLSNRTKPERPAESQPAAKPNLSHIESTLHSIRERRYK